MNTSKATETTSGAGTSISNGTTGGSNTGATTGQVSPWAPQAGALSNIFQGAGTAYDKASGAVAPTDFTASMTPDQMATFRSMLGYAGGNTTPGVESAAGANLIGSGQTGVNGALSGLAGFNPAATNNGAAVIQGAKDYAAGIDIPGAVKSAMQSANETARDVTLPGMESAAAGSGNINSSRTGLAEGLVQRGLAEKAAGISSDLTNSAYTTGADLTANRLAGNNALTLQGLTGEGALGTGATAAGQNLASGAIGDQGSLFDLAQAGGAGQQQNNQETLDNLLQRYQSGVTSPFDALKEYYGIVGANNFGSQSSGTTSGSNTGTYSDNTDTTSTGTKQTTKTPSAFETIGGLATGLGALQRSDRKSKSDITQIGALDDGTPVYRFRYKGDKSRTVHIGLMAQDVEERTPQAVAVIEGVKHVNYDIATKHLV